MIFQKNIIFQKQFFKTFFLLCHRGESMKTIVSAIQKGGQGKTFLSCNFAFWLAKKGFKVCVIDLDTQGNSTYTLNNFTNRFEAHELFLNKNLNFDFSFLNEENQKNKIQIFKANSQLADFEKLQNDNLNNKIQNFSFNLKKLEKYFDYCLIDTAPNLSNILVASFLVADFFITPIELETYSLMGVEKILTVAQNLKNQNPKLQFLGILPNKVDIRKPRQKENLNLLKKHFDKNVIPFQISLRDSFAQALSEQKPIWKIKKSAARKATQELEQIANYIFQNV